MKLSDVNWNFYTVDNWTLAAKTCALIITGTVTVATGIYFDSLDQYQSLQIAKTQEPILKEELEKKQKKAIRFI